MCPIIVVVAVVVAVVAVVVGSKIASYKY